MFAQLKPLKSIVVSDTEHVELYMGYASNTVFGLYVRNGRGAYRTPDYHTFDMIKGDINAWRAFH